ncbi:SUMO ligase [Saccharomycopsis crataegensis]|uniref:SUMO ligase n=1 Tax=Saccharomycopsis crataegensis TaxID=43959 RepID=A0AAV5QW81_9ASCO|nr:SUMO ligase [Saccharomycopsis crataegensis]
MARLQRYRDVDGDVAMDGSSQANNTQRAEEIQDYADFDEEAIQQFDREVEQFMTTLDDFSLPEYVPIDKSTKRMVDTFRVQGHTELISGLKEELIKSTDAYLLNTVEYQPKDKNHTQSVLDKSIHALKSLADMESEIKVLTNATESIKTVVKNRFMEEEELSYETIGHYRNLENPPANLSQLFTDIFGEETAKLANGSSKVDKQLLKLQQHAFVVQHPQEPLPGNLSDNRDDDDDDIEVAGGTVELVCPISRKPFQKPVITTCGHTFSKASLVEVIRSNKQCPISGCERYLNIQNTKPDHLMELRVKSFTAIKDREEKERRQNIEVVA